MSEDVLERANSFASELNEADRQRRIRDLGALHLIHALAAEVRALRKDRERLDWLESQATPGLVWEARQSRTGRGYRLHQHSSEYLGDAVDTGATARSAIDAAMAQGERTNGD